MYKYVIFLILNIFISNYVLCQIDVCDTTKYMLIKLNDKELSRYNCEVYIINSKTKDRFLMLQDDYPKVIQEGLQFDSLYQELIKSLEFNFRRMDTAFTRQNSELNLIKISSQSKLESSTQSINQAQKNILHANATVDHAIIQIKKARVKKWVYLGVGFLAGGLTISILK